MNLMNLEKIERIVKELFSEQTIDESKDIIDLISDAARITAKLIARIAGLAIEEHHEDQARGINEDLLVDQCFQRYQNESVS